MDKKLTKSEIIKALKGLIRDIEKSPIPKKGVFLLKKDNDIMSVSSVNSNNIEDLLFSLRIFIKYKNFDNEALKRENALLRKLLSNKDF